MLTSPQIESYIEQYSSPVFETNKLNKESEEALVELFDLVKKIKNYGKHETEKRKFFIHAPKGTFEEYAKLYDEPTKTLEKWFKTEKDRWYEIKFFYHYSDLFDKPLYAVYINNFQVLAINDSNVAKRSEIDATELIKELKIITENVIEDIKAGTYNENVKNNLSYDMRYGRISRHDYWKAMPEEKEKYAFTNHEIETLTNAKEDTTLISLTARKYYEACAVCYKAVGMETDTSRYDDTDEEHERYGGITPKEIYYRFADGRDEGLSEVPLDDVEEFSKWVRHEEPYTETGGHPYEIIFSWSGKKSIHLYVWDDKLHLTGGEYPANVMAAKMYVALVDSNIPVAFDATAIIDRLQEKDYIGILPLYVWRETYYDAYDTINLEEKTYKRLKDCIVWDQIPEVCLE